MRAIVHPDGRTISIQSENDTEVSLLRIFQESGVTVGFGGGVRMEKGERTKDASVSIMRKDMPQEP